MKRNKETTQKTITFSNKIIDLLEKEAKNKNMTVSVYLETILKNIDISCNNNYIDAIKEKIEINNKKLFQVRKIGCNLNQLVRFCNYLKYNNKINQTMITEINFVLNRNLIDVMKLLKNLEKMDKEK